MSVDGVPATGFHTVGQINQTNTLRFLTWHNALAIAVELVSSHATGAPVVDEGGRFVGFISEFDILDSLERGKDLSGLTALDIMSRSHVAVRESTSLSEAARLMKERHYLNLPVEKNGIITHSVTRHDLLRARLGLGLWVES